MVTDRAQNPKSVLGHVGTLVLDLDPCKDIHSHPELSMQEIRTADIAAERLRATGYEAGVLCKRSSQGIEFRSRVHELWLHNCARPRQRRSGMVDH